MEYAIGQVSEMLGLPISTLRYYDKEGLLPGLRRSSGIRRFSDRDIEALRMIAYLKRTGLGIDSIREFMAWDDESMECFGKRLQLLQRQQKALAEEMERLQGAMDMLTYKCWFYEEAMRTGHRPDPSCRDMPEDVRKAYGNSLGKACC